MRVPRPFLPLAAAAPLTLLAPSASAEGTSSDDRCTQVVFSPRNEPANEADAKWLNETLGDMTVDLANIVNDQRICNPTHTLRLNYENSEGLETQEVTTGKGKDAETETFVYYPEGEITATGHPDCKRELDFEGEGKRPDYFFVRVLRDTAEEVALCVQDKVKPMVVEIEEEEPENPMCVEFTGEVPNRVSNSRDVRDAFSSAKRMLTLSANGGRACEANRSFEVEYIVHGDYQDHKRRGPEFNGYRGVELTVAAMNCRVQEGDRTDGKAVDKVPATIVASDTSKAAKRAADCVEGFTYVLNAMGR